MNLHALLPNPPPRPTRRVTASEVDQLLERLFAAPAVDPGQVPVRARPQFVSGEMRLALAVLEEALRCALRHHASPLRRQREASREALAWMQCEDDEAPFTFVRLCQLFDLDPAWLRETVLRYRRELAARRGIGRASVTAVSPPRARPAP